MQKHVLPNERQEDAQHIHDLQGFQPISKVFIEYRDNANWMKTNHLQNPVW